LDISVKGGICTIKDKAGCTLMVGHQRNNHYEMDCAIDPKYSGPVDFAFLSYAGSDLDLWHRRLAHLNTKSLRRLVKYQMVTGINSLPSNELGPCTGCAKGKHSQSPFPQQASHAESILELLHMDLQGPMPTSSWSGYRYTLGIVDDNSRRSWKFFQKHKDEASDNIEAFITEVENQSGLTVKQIRIDGGGEFVNKNMKD